MFQEIRQLLDLITKSVDTLEQACIETKMEVPSLDDPFDPAHRAFWVNPVTAEATAVATAAASHLGTVLSPPHAVLNHAVGGHWRSAAIRMCLEGSVTEILREAGPEGLHVDNIAAKNGLDSQKLARCLRIMATQHIYREVKPDFFTNNRVSSLLDTLKPSAEIIADPYHKYDGTFGLPAMLGHWLDEAFKASAYLWEITSNPKTAKSGEATETAFSMAVGNGGTYWDYIGQPENAYNQRRFDIGMRGSQIFRSPTSFIAGYDWKSLPANAVVVDVGGGVGAASLSLAKEFPHLKFVIQDRQPVVDAGVGFWKKELPDALSSGRVQLQVHDFFAPQPQNDASIFFVKSVMHDWSDEYCLKILKHLRDAATPSTKLIIIDVILPYACHETEENADGIAGAVSVKAPNPLLANWGTVNDFTYCIDLCMLTLLNGQERTIKQIDQLCKSAGWKITAVRRQHGAVVLHSAIEAVPI
ncbi:S-adenosyl-L-methionine-dependent methyltransferase [Amanita rubescens]|nr:S-adenosyl-L-methionine-dependent methyltransferase [Amanita rubescens]